MVLVGCVVVPSWPGVMSVEPPLPPGSAGEGALHLHTAGKQLGDWVRDQRVDIILLVSHQVRSGSINLQCPIILVIHELSTWHLAASSLLPRTPRNSIPGLVLCRVAGCAVD